jgi:UDP-N-acetylmuramoylalanine--D-glutamate ligase
MNFDMQKSFPSRVSIIGAARSGLAAAEFFISKGSDVFISDTCDEEKLVKILSDKGIYKVRHESSAHTDKVLECDLIVLSPGVPSDIPILDKARENKIPVWSEMELGFRASKATFLAVTGSTGKSTTVSLLGEALNAGGKDAVVAGNIGIPVISIVHQVPKGSIVVAEVSSFQLETIDRFKPLGAAVLNFMKNHLDRYACEDDYYNAKKEIARNFTKENVLVLNANDGRLCEWAKEMRDKTQIVWFGADVSGEDSFWIDGSLLKYRFRENSGIVLNVNDMIIKGHHNHENACVASALAMFAGADVKGIAKGICGFKGLKHRLEFVDEVNKVKFYNDSKSTTAESILVAVKAFPNGVHLIAGGRDKFCDFTTVNEAIKEHVTDVTLIGEAADRMESVWNGLTTIKRAPTLDAAIDKAMENAVPGDVVVFSPGCSSFDMFKNYEERGDVFKKLVGKRNVTK